MNASRIYPLRRREPRDERQFANEFVNTDAEMHDLENPMLPPDRKASSGRTYSSPWDAGIVGPGAAIEQPPRPHKLRDAVFGWLMAAVICLTLYVLYVFGKVPA